MTITDLVLLIGTNPLPNYVVAKWFTEHAGNNIASIKRIWLVHSTDDTHLKQKGTDDLAKYLKEVLSPHCKISFKYVPLTNVSSRNSIKHDITDNLIQPLIQPLNKENFEHIHLNYTGGTKTMSVHVYSTLEKAYGNKASFSYLDARNYELKWDDNSNNTGDLRKKIKITIEDLLWLHGYKIDSKESSDKAINWTDSLNAFEQIINDDKLKNYLNWQKDFLRKIYYDGEDYIEGINKFNKHIEDENIKSKIAAFNEGKYSDFQILFDSLPNDHRITNEDSSLFIPKCNNDLKKRLKPSVKNFLDGKWLEYYIVKVLNEENSKDQLKCISLDKGNNFIHSLEANKQGVSKKLELDIAILYGYQLIGISITTDNKADMCKMKAFEVLHRVSQIGGEESKAMLICCFEDKIIEKGKIKEDNRISEFEEDIKSITGTGEEKFKTIGIDKLKKNVLIKEIEEFICGNY
jgi:hypothetical protein